MVSLIKRSFSSIFILLPIIFLLAACSPVDDDLTPTDNPATVAPLVTEDVGGDPYPAATIFIPPPPDYPGPQQGYPAPTFGYPAPIELDESKRVTITSAEIDDVIVRGTGPAGTPIKVISVSHVGSELGFGTIDPDGNFEIAVTSPLEANTLIGIMLSDQSMEGEFRTAAGASDIPFLGLVLATFAVVEP
jgi:hypothetical protein